jgi:cytochrome d ubiquinol oxidase subunit I
MIFTTFIMYMLLYVGLLISYVSVVFYLARKAGEPGNQVEKPDVPAGAPLQGA